MDYMRNAGVGSVPTATSQVQQRLAQHEDRLQVLHNKVRTLMESLTPVLVQGPPPGGTSAKSAEVTQTLVPLANQIQAQSDLLEQSITVIDTINDRLQL